MPQIAYLFLNDDLAGKLISRWCQTDDHAYASKFKKLHRQQQSLGGRALLRMLWAINNSPLSSILHISTASSGAIRLEGRKGEKIWGSISHSHDLVCAGISEQMSIGIDCELKDPNRNLPSIFAILDPFNTLSAPSFQTWVELEALGKALETGISQQTIDHFQDLSSANRFCFHNFEITNYAVCACLYDHGVLSE